MSRMGGMMPIDDIRDIRECFKFDDQEQNAAICYLIQEAKAQRKVDEETVAALRDIRAAVESLTMTDLKQGVKWNFLDKIGVSVLGLVASIIGGVVVLILNCILNPK